jgi:hypothetical protein
MLNLCGLLSILCLVLCLHWVEHLFNIWYKQGGNQYNSLLLTGATVFCWSMWLTRNDIVLINLSLKHIYRFYLGEHICYASRSKYSVTMKKKTAFYELVVSLSLQWCLSFFFLLSSQLYETILSGELCNNWGLIPPWAGCFCTVI